MSSRWFVSVLVYLGVFTVGFCENDDAAQVNVDTFVYTRTEVSDYPMIRAQMLNSSDNGSALEPRSDQEELDAYYRWYMGEQLGKLRAGTAAPRAQNRFFYSSLDSRSICDGNSIDINCLPTHFVNILRVYYGRARPEICPDDTAWLHRKNCGEQRRPTRKVRRICQWKRRCVVKVNKNTFSFDPCDTGFTISPTPKYMTIKYQCVGSREVQGCEGDTATMVCQGSTRIRVISAFYGRLSRFVCIHPAPAAIDNVKCGLLQQNLATLRDLCNGKVRCSFIIGNQRFHDPCPGIFKYLQATWECV